ncbi:hypothetical protein HMPREF3291_21640 [Bacillus sp. HMSC76G11]|nr:hypothetical protein HMPREF3291_21640 [Bacillus sp. HMSC76G11]
MLKKRADSKAVAALNQLFFHFIEHMSGHILRKVQAPFSAGMTDKDSASKGAFCQYFRIRSGREA